MDYYSYYAANDYLAHHGVLGMKWGQHIFGKDRRAAIKKGKALSSEDERRKATRTKIGATLLGGASSGAAASVAVNAVNTARTVASVEKRMQSLNNIARITSMYGLSAESATMLLAGVNSGAINASAFAKIVGASVATIPVEPVAVGAALIGGAAVGAMAIKKVNDRYASKAASTKKKFK